MREYEIITDATCDLPVAVLEDLGISVIPMEFRLGINEYVHYPDARELGVQEFYERLSNGESSVTSQINPSTYQEYFEAALKRGNDVIYIAFSSGLSGTFNTAVLIASQLEEQYPGSKIVCLDSLCASVGEGMLVYYAAKRKQQGATLDELSAWIQKEKLNLCHWFTVDDLDFLRRGGRVSRLTAKLGGMLKIKPVLHVDDEGHLIPMSKAKGRKKALKELVERMEKTAVKPEEQVVFIGHGNSPQDAQFVEKLVREKFAVQDVITSYIGPIIGTHSGPGTIALFFFGNTR